MRFENEKVYSDDNIMDCIGVFMTLKCKGMVVSIDGQGVDVKHIKYSEEENWSRVRIFTSCGKYNIDINEGDVVEVSQADDYATISICVKDNAGINKHVIILKHS